MGRYISVATSFLPTQRRELLVTGGNTCSWSVPTGVSSATFEIWGGGGAGGPKCCCYCGASEGGAAGGYSIKTIAVTAGSTYTIVAGQGGCAVYCSVSGVNCGCRGCTTYVTGTNLSNFCAEGGYGGYTVCCRQNLSCCGGLAYGGDFNLQGGDAVQMGGCGSFICHFSWGGPAMFGGRATHATDHCQAYFSGCSNGVFPGGGGAGFFSCCCDCCACQGSGAPGLVKVTY